ncbi:hypothetical protein NQZ68_025227 [Dissostichus eleginoides]|nr:hypothetical protein NQZ68_025227 [Dissostichus eleginoides]
MGPFGNRIQGCRSDQFGHTSPHSWTDRKMKMKEGGGGGDDELCSFTENPHFVV